MSLLREIQDDAVNANVDISTVLRKCQILATRLRNEKLKLWVERELNGYQSKEDLPEYRILRVQSYGNFVASFGRSAQHLPIAPSNLPDEWQENLTTVYLMSPISYYTSLITNQDSSGLLQEAWPADVIKFFGSKIYKDWNCIRAWKEISTGSISALLDTVRNRILRFVLEIETEAPNAGEAPPNTRPIPEERVNQVFNTYIQGNVANLAAGSQGITQSTQITIIQNDLKSLKKYLESLGVEQQDLDELGKAIREDGQSTTKASIGDKVAAWIGKMVSKAANDTWKIAAATAASLLTQALLRYYGIG